MSTYPYWARDLPFFLTLWFYGGAWLGCGMVTALVLGAKGRNGPLGLLVYLVLPLPALIYACFMPTLKDRR